GDKTLHPYRSEYPGQQQYVPDPLLPSQLSADEFRDCVRALKGRPLRQEVYSFDGSPAEQVPYTIAENQFELRRIQPRGTQRHAVFFAVGRESLAINFERNPSDPRVTHAFVLQADEVGNPLQSCSVVYGRTMSDPALPPEVTQDQQRRYITHTE